MDDDDFAAITRKPLKLNGKSEKKKKKKKEDPNDAIEAEPTSESRVIISTITEAEKAFKAKQEKIAEGRILQKASKTHKQRVEEFNKHLDSLSEHYDIPKVSWTK